MNQSENRTGVEVQRIYISLLVETAQGIPGSPRGEQLFGGQLSSLPHPSAAKALRVAVSPGLR